jgi:hypothetical protein
MALTKYVRKINQVKYIDLRRKYWNKENDKFNKKWKNIVVI